MIEYGFNGVPPDPATTEVRPPVVKGALRETTPSALMPSMYRSRNSFTLSPAGARLSCPMPILLGSSRRSRAAPAAVRNPRLAISSRWAISGSAEIDLYQPP
jgi:hypothetical protein